MDKIVPLDLPSQEEQERYDGYWVCAAEGRIVGYGKSPATAIKRATKKGFPDAVLFRSPLVRRGVRHYYSKHAA